MIRYTYDDLGRLSTVTDNRLAGNNVTTYTYDNASNVGTATTPNGVTAQFTYDSLNRVSSLVSATAGYSYARNPDGSLKNAVELGGRTVQWSYDGINRLTGESIAGDAAGNNGAVGYTLDPVGNRLSDASTLNSVASVASTFNADDEQGDESYDQNGNVTAADGMSYTYDSENHMISATGNGKVITMTYDAFGNRVSKTANGVTTTYLVEDDVNPTGLPQVVDELTNGAVTRTYTYGLQRINENQIVNSTWTPSFYGYDGGGNVRQLTNSAGTVTDTYEYDAYGNSFTVSGSTPNEMMYRGEQYDPDLALYYLRARYYNPASGRFMSRDPWSGDQFDVRTLHKYLYVGSDPVDNVDPRGRDLFEYAMESNAAIPEAKLLSIYGCIADAGLAAVNLVLDPTITTSDALGGGSAILGCVVLMPGLNELAESGAKIATAAKGTLEFIGYASGIGSCALDAKDFVNGLNSLIAGSPDGVDEMGEAIESLGGCVGDALGYTVTHPGQALQGLGLE